MDEETIETVDTSGSDVLDSVSDSPDTPPPVQVISVDELVERLTSTGEGEDQPMEDPAEDAEPEEPTAAEEYFSYALQDTTGEETVQLLKEIKTELVKLEPHELMTTNFSDYTVTEGLLLLALLGGVAWICIKMLRRGFSWLTW